MPSQAVRSAIPWVLYAALAAALPVGAQAAVFVCRDGHGGTITTDHLDSNCLQYGGKELNADGSVRRLILTRAQAQAQQEQQQREQARIEQQLQQQREQRALLGRYPDEAALRAARQADLQSVQGLIDAARQRLQVLDRQRHENDLDAQFYPDGKYPADLLARMEINRTQRAQEQQMVSAQQRELLRVDQHYAQLRERLLPLWQQQGATDPAPPAH